MIAIRFSAFLMFSLLFTFAAQSESAQIVDGDTLKLNGTTYRISGIVAPEYGQKCRESGSGTWPCGKEAVAKLEALATAGPVTCKPLEDDLFGRKVADCFAGNVNLGQVMVRTGYAWAFVLYSDAYVSEAELARSKSIGIWQGDTQPAWEYRAKRWQEAEQEAPEGCPIKGNISKHGRIYHAPWSPWYTRTKVSVQKGERWFCSEGEALDAGWRVLYWGRKKSSSN